MSRSSEEMKATASGAYGSAHLAAPRLSVGGVGYAVWRPQMDVHLQRTGAEDIHTTVLTELEWLDMSTRVAGWAKQALASALALVNGNSGSSSSSSTGDDKKATAAAAADAIELKAARLIVTQTVERSRRVFGTLYSTLPEELRPQVEHIAQGWAYGLWHWLQTKYQSTEEDSVGELLAQWTTIRQDDTESFDAYRARVSKLRELLKSAKEDPSARMYAFMLLDRLQPRYKQAVLALKAGGQLKDASMIVWDTVTALLNAHERDALRMEESIGSAQGQAMSAPARKARTQGANSEPKAQAGRRQKQSGDQPRTRADIQCFNCDLFGHFSRDCPKPQKPRIKDATSAFGSDSRLGVDERMPRAKERQAMAAQQQRKKGRRGKSDRYESCSDDSQDDDQEDRSPVSGRVNMVYVKAVLRGMTASNSLNPTPQSKVAAVSASTVGTGTTMVSQSKSVTCKSPAALPLKKEAVSLISERIAKEVILPSAKASSALVLEPKPQHQAMGSTSKSAAGIDSPLDHSFGVDSMASLHITGSKALLRSLTDCPPIPVRVADGGIVTVRQRGTVHLQVAATNGRAIKVEIANVYYHERFTANLLSSNVLVNKLGWSYHSTPKETYLTLPGGNKLMLSTKDSVSILDSTAPNQHHVYALGELVGTNVESLVQLHAKLGHMTFRRMVHLMKGGVMIDVSKVQATSQELREAERRISECRACTQGKSTRTRFGHRGLDKGQRPGETLHFDTFQVQVEAADGRKSLEYGTTATDPYSSWKCGVHTTSKDQIPAEVIGIIRLARTQFSRRVKRVYTDGGTEFINGTVEEYCTKRGIAMHHSPARTQQLNGVSENTVRSAKDATRMSMIHAHTPMRFWKHAYFHHIFTWNRSHTSATTGKTPYEMLRGRLPSIRHWGTFGCDAYCHLPKEQRAALAPKSEPCVYLGHHSRQNCASVYVLHTKKVIQTRDVVFRNNSFTFGRAVTKGSSAVQMIIDSDTNTDHKEELDSYDDPAVESSELDDGPAQHISELEPPPQYDIDCIIGHRVKRNKREFHVRWLGYEESEATWERETDLRADAPQVVKDYLATCSKKRESPRLHPSAAAGAASTSTSAATEIAESSESEHESADPHVHNAMCAVSAMQTPTDMNGSDHAALVLAVQSGIARLEQQTPYTYREAMASPDAVKWRAAMDKEIAMCIEKGVWEEIHTRDLPAGANVLPCKWVFKVKIDETGAAVTYKARLTPKGFRQKEGKDYFEVFAPTGMYKTMRFGLSVAAKWDHEIVQMDVPGAFLNSDLDEDVYMQLPEGCRDGKTDIVLRLKKSLYGLKQAPRNWSIRLKSFIVDKMGYSSTVSDQCLYWRRSRTGRLMMLFVFVDDIQSSFHRDDQIEWNHYKAQLVKEFDTKDMGVSTWMLGMRITRNRKERTITLDQEVYITKALEKYGYSECTTRSTPEVVGAAHQDPTDEQRKPADRQRYMEIVGTLMYAAISTRLDIAHAVFYLACHMLAPTQLHMAAAERVIRYLAGTRSLGLVFGSRNGGVLGDSRGQTRTQVDVCAYADADWANSRGDRRSITGWAAKVNGDPISWASKKQRTVALSTCEAELYAEAAAIQEVLWLRGLLKELGLQCQVGSVVYGDNQSAIAVTKNGIKGERTKHVDVKYHFVTETVERGDVRLKWIPTAEQQADIFTKALAQPAFELLRSQLMMH